MKKEKRRVHFEEKREKEEEQHQKNSHALTSKTLPLSLFFSHQMSTLPVWFRSLVWSEVVLQLPFFFYALKCFLKGDQRVRKPAVAYGFSVATTLVPILAELAFGEQARSLSFENRTTLVGFYLPYFFLPLWIGTWMLVDNAPFSGSAKKANNKKR
jgi:cation transport ATPase